MGLPAGGVGGMKLKAKDQIVFAGSVRPDGELATFTSGTPANASRMLSLMSRPDEGRTTGHTHSAAADNNNFHTTFERVL